jgi:hypothetical protein
MSSPSLPPSSKTSSAAAPTATPEITVRFAETDHDAVAIHRFLLVVAGPAMRCPVNPVKSFEEVCRVIAQEAALMAIADGFLVGTLGIIKPTWWYGDGDFLTDRWHFVLPDHRHGAVDKALMEEAYRLAGDAGLEFIDQGKIRERRGKLLMFPRVHTPSGTLSNHLKD